MAFGRLGRNAPPDLAGGPAVGGSCQRSRLGKRERPASRFGGFGCRSPPEDLGGAHSGRPAGGNFGGGGGACGARFRSSSFGGGAGQTNRLPLSGVAGPPGLGPAWREAPRSHPGLPLQPLREKCLRRKSGSLPVENFSPGCGPGGVVAFVEGSQGLAG